MSDHDALVMAQALCSRLCHDLAGPLGAIGSGAELLDDEADDEVVALLARSAATAAQRLRLLRAVLGRPASGSLSPDEARAVLADHLAGAGGARAADLSWTLETNSTDDRTRRLIQLVLTLAVVALDAMPNAKHIAIGGALPRTIQVSVNGGGAARPDGLEALAAGLDGGPAVTDPRAVLAYYAGVTARHLGVAVRVEPMPGVLHFHVKQTA
ncbi:histidine phosphotransferase family protein [Rhodospira trueperi]|uniref:Histidine phosphotransferase ChpT n=1 Tax=Rhodospira trueperi TaxID=69960 RepID=A0A1G7FNQ1_9PROT|nr:histidine phosphotransferase family protein [Rhodospira trueperi]SDE77469.1 histidine phosphotransferase ChpT [Rhodospira trueperi]